MAKNNPERKATAGAMVALCVCFWALFLGATLFSAQARASGMAELGGVSVPAALPQPLPGGILFELRASDKSLRNAFQRWGEEHRRQVIWRLAGDIPLDAVASISSVSLVDALTQAALAFADKQEPFVIREYDNAIVVLPRWTVRP
jgi:hypothetical protein